MTEPNAVLADAASAEQFDYEINAKFFEEVADAVVVADQRAVIRKVNMAAQKMFGYHQARMVGHSINMLIPERFRERHGEHILSFFRKMDHRQMGRGLELWAVDVNGREFEVDISLTPLLLTTENVAAAAIRERPRLKPVEAP